MELRYRREAAVGFMLIAGTVTFIFLMMWLRGQRLGGGEIVTVSFNDVGGLREGDPVRTSGVRVGRVVDIALRGAGDVLVSFDLGAGGGAPRADASARILSMDLFGARFIDYNPGRATEALPANRVLTGQRIEDLSEMAAALSTRSKTLLDSLAVATIFVASELRTTLRSTQTLLGTLNTGASASSEQLQGALEGLRRSLQRVDLLMEQNGPAVGEALRGMNRASANLDSLSRALSHASAQFDSILVKINSGRGPAGALVNDTAMVSELRETNAALRDLLIDFKANPGRYIRLRL